MDPQWRARLGLEGIDRMRRDAARHKRAQLGAGRSRSTEPSVEVSRNLSQRLKPEFVSFGRAMMDPATPSTAHDNEAAHGQSRSHSTLPALPALYPPGPSSFGDESDEGVATGDRWPTSESGKSTRPKASKGWIERDGKYIWATREDHDDRASDGWGSGTASSGFW